MRQKLHITKINLATEKQSVLDLKAELQKAKDAARVAREAAEAVVKASYERGVLDTEARLSKKVAIVCKDYCTESWGVAMDRAGVPADSELRKAENILFLEDIREILDAVPLSEQLPTTQVLPPEGSEETQPPMTAKPIVVAKYGRQSHNVICGQCGVSVMVGLLMGLNILFMLSKSLC